MEQKYWEQFLKSGDVSDYLGYKMEVYGHGGGEYSGAAGDRSGGVADGGFDDTADVQYSGAAGDRSGGTAGVEYSGTGNNGDHSFS